MKVDPTAAPRTAQRSPLSRASSNGGFRNLLDGAGGDADQRAAGFSELGMFGRRVRPETDTRTDQDSPRGKPTPPSPPSEGASGAAFVALVGLARPRTAPAAAASNASRLAAPSVVIASGRPAEATPQADTPQTTAPETDGVTADADSSSRAASLEHGLTADIERRFAADRRMRGLKVTLLEEDGAVRVIVAAPDTSTDAAADLHALSARIVGEAGGRLAGFVLNGVAAKPFR